MNVENIVPGIVIIRQFLNSDEQMSIIDFIYEQGGMVDSEGKWNFFNKRGRRFDGLTGDYERLSQIPAKAQDIVLAHDDSIPKQKANHVLSLWYPDKNGMGWHIDGHGTNNGDEYCPVYSLTLGNSCIFDLALVGTSKSEKISVTLNSGDIIVFGGPQRLMFHRVSKVLPNTYTHKYRDDFDARINLTFRQCTDIDATLYTTEKYTERLKKKWNN